MGEIISSDVFKQRQLSKAREKSKNPPTTAELQTQYDSIVHAVTCEWELHFRRNTLNEFFTTLLSKDYGNVLEVDVIKQIERDLQINPVIFSPNSMPLPMADGWIAGFSVDNVNYATPPMLEESFARALNVLLFIELKQQKDNNI